MFCLPATTQLHLWEYVAVSLHSCQRAVCSIEDFVCHFCPDLLALVNPLSLVSRVHTFRVHLSPTLHHPMSLTKTKKGIKMESTPCNLVLKPRAPWLLWEVTISAVFLFFLPRESYRQRETPREASTYSATSRLSRTTGPRRESKCKQVHCPRAWEMTSKEPHFLPLPYHPLFFNQSSSTTWFSLLLSILFCLSSDFPQSIRGKCVYQDWKK